MKDLIGKENLGSGIELTLFWMLVCIGALLAVPQGPIFLSIVRVAFIGVIVTHALRLRGRISFRAYVIAETLSISAIIVSGIGGNNLYAAGLGGFLLLVFLIILGTSILVDRRMATIRRLSWDHY